MSDVTHVVGIDASKNSVLIEKDGLAKKTLATANIYRASKVWATPGWHRILNGHTGGSIGTGIISLNQDFNMSNGGGVIFAFMGSGYVGPNINVLCKVSNPFSKIRVLTKNISNTTSLFIDVYYNRSNSNGIKCLLSNCPDGVTLTDFADTIMDIPEGFTATEFDI